MKGFTDLKPRIKAPTLGQCCAPVDLEGYNDSYLKRRKKRCADKGFDPELCTKHAPVEYKGKQYCRPHAGQLALAHMLNEELPDWAKD